VTETSGRSSSAGEWELFTVSRMSHSRAAHVGGPERRPAAIGGGRPPIPTVRRDPGVGICRRPVVTHEFEGSS